MPLCLQTKLKCHNEKTIAYTSRTDIEMFQHLTHRALYVFVNNMCLLTLQCMASPIVSTSKAKSPNETLCILTNVIIEIRLMK